MSKCVTGRICDDGNYNINLFAHKQTSAKGANNVREQKRLDKSKLVGPADMSLAKMVCFL